MPDIAQAVQTQTANPQQIEAITTTDGPLLIIAGPGSGKTYTLVERIVHLITTRGVTPEQLMVVTFTEKAAQELTTRIANRLAEIGVAFNLNEMYLGTFHSICLRWLQDHCEHTRLKHNFTMMDAFDQHYFLYQRIAEYDALPGVHYITGAHPADAPHSNDAAADAAEVATSAASADGFDAILARVNEFNELLYDWVIPHLFSELYEVNDFTNPEEYTVELVRVPASGFYELHAQSDLIVRANGQGIGANADKSFHLDAYCFDSRPERDLFWRLLADQRVKKVYFTGMLTHGQSDFYVQYIDPTSHTIRTYYPDFLLQRDDGHYVIVEVKRDDQIDTPVVRAKQDFAEQMAKANAMSYRIIPSTIAAKGQYEVIWDPSLQETYLTPSLIEGAGQ